MKTAKIIAITVFFMTCFLASCGGGGATDSFEDGNVSIDNIRAVYMPPKSNAIAILYDVQNNSDEDTETLNLTHCEVYQNGVEVTPFSGTHLPEWKEFFDGYGAKHNLTKLMTGGKVTVYALYVLDDEESPLTVRFYNKLAGTDLLAEKEIQIDEIEE